MHINAVVNCESQGFLIHKSCFCEEFEQPVITVNRRNIVWRNDVKDISECLKLEQGRDFVKLINVKVVGLIKKILVSQ